MSVIALIPARSGSKGIPGKNFRKLGDRTLVGWAAKAAREAGITERWVSSDTVFTDLGDGYVRHIHRPADLAQDDTPMIAVLQHAMQQIPGEADDIWVLLQPTQPFRTPEHVRKAIALLQSDGGFWPRGNGPDSIVSVTRIPDTHAPEFVVRVGPWPSGIAVQEAPLRRQDVHPAYIRDGTVYAFWRHTVTEFGTIYGADCRPLVIPPEDSCELDIPTDWDACVKRWNARASTRS